jgi:uncharacterized protein (DUF849 family)
MNFGDGLVINRTADLEIMARHAMEWGVKPELEVFDMGQIGIALKLIARGVVPGDPLFQFCLGIDGGAPARAESMIAMRAMLPANAHWAAFGISRDEMPMAALAVIVRDLGARVLSPAQTREKLKLENRYRRAA